jgi:hypothetical protein
MIEKYTKYIHDNSSCTYGIYVLTVYGQRNGAYHISFDFIDKHTKNRTYGEPEYGRILVEDLKYWKKVE